jgi:hypothetical protein
MLTLIKLPASNWRVPDERHLITIALVHVPIHSIVAQGQLTAREPLGKRRAGIVKHALPPPRPDNLIGDGGPVLFRPC